MPDQAYAPAQGPRRTWRLPIGEPHVGLTVTVSYDGPGRGWGACWYGRGVGCCWTPWGALWGAWRFHRTRHAEAGRG